MRAVTWVLFCGICGLFVGSKGRSSAETDMVYGVVIGCAIGIIFAFIFILLHSSLKIRKHKLLTIIEYAVAVILVAFIAAESIHNSMLDPNRARVVVARMQINEIARALDQYHKDNGFYPSAEQGLKALVSKPTGSPQPLHWDQSGYLKRLYLDPWSEPYQYRNPGKFGRVDIFSFGADRVDGGEGFGSDIGNWEK